MKKRLQTRNKKWYNHSVVPKTKKREARTFKAQTELQSFCAYELVNFGKRKKNGKIYQQQNVGIMKTSHSIEGVRRKDPDSKPVQTPLRWNHKLGGHFIICARQNLQAIDTLLRAALEKATNSGLKSSIFSKDPDKKKKQKSAELLKIEDIYG
jgi:hypothetical protein